LADPEALSDNLQNQSGIELTYATPAETRRERALNKMRKLFSQAVFRGVMLRSKPMKLSGKSAIVFAPHQDDETFGCGGLIALKRERGIPVRVVILTDGAACFGDAARDAAGERITQLRNGEVAAATATLGVPVEDLEFLSYPDGGLNSLSDADRAQAIDRIVTLLRTFRPEEVYVTHRHDHHKDHEAAFRMVTDAVLRSGLTVDLLQYPIWLVWFSGLGRRLRWRDLAGALVLPIHGVSQRKREAMTAFRSQLETLPSGSVERFYWHYELFFATKISELEKTAT
jgi:LmbE family N-acetylglucosaminyl deacetylase